MLAHNNTCIYGLTPIRNEADNIDVRSFFQYRFEQELNQLPCVYEGLITNGERRSEGCIFDAN